MDDNVEMAELKKKLESLMKENEQVKNESHAAKLKEVECENKKLKSLIKSNKEEYEIKLNDLTAANNDLKLLMENFRNCDECTEQFDTKTLMKTHILSNHLERKAVCDYCSNHSNEKSDMKEHKVSEHSKETQTDLLNKKYEELYSTIANQKDKIFKDLYRLKQKEVKQTKNCQCRGRFCKINHSRYRWTSSMADILFNKFKSANSNKICRTTGNIECEKCDVEFCDEDVMKTHIQKNHELDSSFKCHNCDQRYTNSETLKRHNETDHQMSPRYFCKECDTNFPQMLTLENHIRRIHNSKFGCQPCEQNFVDENSLMNHMNEDHETNLVEKTFFNPSASL